MEKKFVTIIAYETEDGRNYVGRPFFIDETLRTCKLKQGCVINSTNLPENKSYEQGIKELYKKALKQDVVQFGLEKVIKTHRMDVVLE